MSSGSKKIVKIVSLAVLVAILITLAVLIWRFVMDRDGFKAWMDERGVIGYLAYIVMVILQILVALVPGGPIEMAGGYAFGPVLGTSLFFAGSVFGSLLVFSLVRKYGRPLVELFFSDKDIKIVKFLENPRKRDILFIILFIIPGSPKDLLCYVAGLTPMKMWFFILVATFGRLPAVIASAISGSALGESNYKVAAISLGIILVLSGIGVLVYRKISKGHEETAVNETVKSRRIAGRRIEGRRIAGRRIESRRMAGRTPEERMESESSVNGKKEFRKSAIAKRNSLDEKSREKWSESIADQVMELVRKLSVKNVLIYASYGSEVDTFGLMNRLWRENVDIYCPKVEGASEDSNAAADRGEALKKMEFYKISGPEDLEEGFKGILEPKTSIKYDAEDAAQDNVAECAQLETLEKKNTIIIVPGCAFDREGHRMGYGGGFYDRYLANHPELKKVGICFEQQICENVPCDAYDVRMDLVICQED